MADRYIDCDETQIYGERAAQMMEQRIAPLASAEFKPAVAKMGSELKHATETVGRVVAAARKSGGGARLNAQAKQTLLAAALNLLGRFSTHLDTHRSGTLDRRAFFPEDGTARGVGRSATRVALAMARIGSLLESPDCPVIARETWLAEFSATEQAFEPAIESANSAATDRAAATPQVEAARAAWMSVYGCSKLLVECVLRQSGDLHLMPLVFHDLAVPANAKVTESPEPEAPAAPAA